MNKTAETIDEYIAGFPEEVQSVLQTIRATIREAAPGAVEAIAYQMPTFRLNGNLIHFAAFRNHIGIYPTPSGIDAFGQELSPFRTGKGTLQFPIDQPIPIDLIRKIVTHRVMENEGKSVRKK